MSKRLAAGVAEQTDARRRSAQISVDSPLVAVEDIETGEANAFDALRGTD